MTTDVVDSALEELGRQDPDVAATAAECHSLLVEGGGRHAYSRFVLQGLLWYVLPRRWPSHQRIPAVESLARLMEACELKGYARICRSRETTAVLGAHACGPRFGDLMARACEERSGVCPPDLPELRWSKDPGPVERDAFLTVAGVLELGVEAGEVESRSGRSLPQRVELARRCLEARQPGLGGRTLLQGIGLERIGRWVGTGSEARRALLEPLVPDLCDPPVPSDLVGLEPLRWLLERSADGLPVNRKEDPSPDVVAEAHARFGLANELGPAEPLGLLISVLGGLGLVRRRGRRLRTTEPGRQLLGEPETLWYLAASRTWTFPRFHNAVAELVFALLLRGGPEREGRLVAHVHAILGGDAPMAEVARAMRRFAWLAHPLGALRIEPGHDRGFALTELGRATAIVSLRSRATQPVG